MLAKKKVSGNIKTFTRDKEAKIGAITEATRVLIETIGYERMTIRDIAEKADVSVGLIYKYFPAGKFDILVKGIGAQNMDILLNIKQPEVIDFDDFPGYMRTLIRNMFQVFKDNSAMIKALVAATLFEGDIAEGVKNIDLKDYAAISKFFSSFKGVDIGGQDPVKLLLYWGITVKGTLISIMIYPIPSEDEESLIDLMVDQSLRIWGYRKP